MKVKLRTYGDPHRYEKDFPDKEETVESTTQALKMAREGVAKVRGTNKFVGYKIFSKHGEVKYKLPSY